MKEKFDQIKAAVAKLEGRTKKLIAAVAGLILFSVVVALLLNGNKSFEVLFSGLNTEEAQQIIGKLQESGVDYQYTNNGEILVPSKILDQTRASLAFEGYPKNGFGYQVFTENAGLMTTDADKARYELYDLQNRIGATIMLFDGVKDAKVTIALGEKSKYVLNKDAREKSSATAVLTMMDGDSPTLEQAKAVQRLVSTSIPGMEMEDVAVFDSNGNDVSVAVNGGTTQSGKESEEIARVVEGQIESKVLNVLNPFYGMGNVRISVKAQINMQKLIRETVTYSTPEKRDEDDKTGIVSHESGAAEISGTKEAVAQGVAGAETNADVPEYDTGSGNKGVEGYGSKSYDKDYLVNQIKEQGQVDPGVLDDLTLSVAINGENYGNLTINEIRSLAGNAAGIQVEDWNGKIAVVCAPFYQDESGKQPQTSLPDNPFFEKISTPLFYVIAGGLLLIIVTVIVLVIVSRRKKKAVPMEDEPVSPVMEEPVPVVDQQIIDFQNDRGMELKKNIRDFTEDNPEISAQLLKTWLNGGKQDEQQ